MTTDFLHAHVERFSVSEPVRLAEPARYSSSGARGDDGDPPLPISLAGALPDCLQFVKNHIPPGLPQPSSTELGWKCHGWCVFPGTRAARMPIFLVHFCFFDPTSARFPGLVLVAQQTNGF